ncbi:MAG: hypothetical protein GWN99_13265 [Gemmatimonadetes bacterium]|uniref:Uncharacterized protein n=1 Tax=Candidatus Kutchimonas denitrificans TaxID=3056748 RepID=A0AAE4Z8M2_9BACT|nr:hypothetical protein [Gemmatimonadota bacterium]NIR75849.1 hypothetical protein [Candidatus Kutchimonas denitrificans]NIS02016.1 hypothetical protein [Gemmatimonadota bacterium]NIT67820.1 hypothetical protein [Gemmatimonadota bacterium]NIU53807.1 hypothetical protein [Gemmatimonadota bacterium]
MTSEDVQRTLIKLFKDVNAVDPNLSDEEIAEIELPDLALFDQELSDDPEFKKQALFERMRDELQQLTGGTEPFLSPSDGTIFDRGVSIGALANEIAEYT